MIDYGQGVLGIEWISGKSVRFLLGGGAEGEDEVSESDDVEEVEELPAEENPLDEYHVTTGAW